MNNDTSTPAPVVTFSAARDLLARRPHFRRLWSAEVVSYIGDWLTYVAVSFFAISHSDSLFAVATVLAAHSLPHAVLAPIAGTLTDRFDRKKLLIGANLLQALLALTMAGAAALQNLWLLEGLLLLRVSVGTFFTTANTAALPRVVERDELVLGNSIASATWSVTFSAGVAIGGLLAAIMSPTAVIIIDALTFLVAAALLTGLPAMPTARTAKTHTRDLVTSVHKEMRQAWLHAKPRPRLVEALLAKAPIALAGGGAWVLLNATANDTTLLGSGALTLGLLQSARGIGTGIGPIAAAHLRSRGLSEQRAWIGISWLAFISIGLFSVSTAWPALLLFATLWGMAVGANWVFTTARIQQLAPDAMLGRLSAFDNIGFTSAQSGGALLGALVADASGVPASAAWLALALAVTLWFALRASAARGHEPRVRDTAYEFQCHVSEAAGKTDRSVT